MQTLEKPTLYIPDMIDEEIRELRHDNLARYEYGLLNNEDDHPWWPFFDGGVSDTNGDLWAIYNRWCDETRPEGWRVTYCGNDETDFRELAITKIVRSTISKPAHDSPGLITFQLYLHDEAAGLTDNDILNLLLYHDDSGISQAKLQMWNQNSPMQPINWENP